MVVCLRLAWQKSIFAVCLDCVSLWSYFLYLRIRHRILFLLLSSIFLCTAYFSHPTQFSEYFADSGERRSITSSRLDFPGIFCDVTRRSSFFGSPHLQRITSFVQHKACMIVTALEPLIVIQIRVIR